jgi:hypothetical protein
MVPVATALVHLSVIELAAVAAHDFPACAIALVFGVRSPHGEAA